LLDKITKAQEIVKHDYRLLYDNVPEFQKFTLDQYIKSKIIVTSRLFEFEIGEKDEKAFLPLVDMCNHKVPNKTDWKFNEKRKGFEIVATETIPEGE
jgi:histone-lysine N-methyltransferase SETD3